MKTIKLIIILSFVIQISYSQKVINELNNYKFNNVECILRDSIWMNTEVGKQCDFYNQKQNIEVNLTVIPQFQIKKDSFTYVPNTSLLNYIEIDTFNILGYLCIKDSLLGIVNAFSTKAIKSKLIIDENGDLIIPSLSNVKYGKNYRWEIVNYDLCYFNNNDLKIYNFLKINRPKYYFFIIGYKYLFFIVDDKLKIYSPFDEKVHDEDCFINGISKIEHKKGEQVLGSIKHSTIGDKDIYYSIDFKRQ
jgi:hypothetical protein